MNNFRIWIPVNTSIIGALITVASFYRSNRIYATLIIRGTRAFDQVPVTLKDQVRQILIDLEMEHLAD